MTDAGQHVKSSYLPGIDLAKLFVMFTIVCAHIMDGGLFPLAYDAHPVLSRFVFYFLYCLFAGLTVYALATGYLLINSKCKYTRLLSLWVQMVFTGLLVTVVLKATGLVEISFKDFTTVFRPLSSKCWWYMSSYFIVALFAPLLNEGIRRVPRQRLEMLFLVAFPLICISEFFTKKGFVVIEHGFCADWLLLLYVLGAYLRLYQPFRNLKPRVCFAAVLVIVTLTSGVDAFVPTLNVPFLTKVFGNFRYYDLASPSILLMGVFLFTGFCNLKIENPRVVKTLKFLSPAILGVYLIHFQPFLRERCLEPFLSRLDVGSLGLALLVVFGGGFVVFFVCLALDLLRVRLFDLLRVNARVESVCERISAIFFKRNDSSADCERRP